MAGSTKREPGGRHDDAATQCTRGVLRASMAFLNYMSLVDLRVVEARSRIDRKFDRLRAALRLALEALTEPARQRLGHAWPGAYQFGSQSSDSPHAAIVDALAKVVLSPELQAGGRPSSAALRSLAELLEREDLEQHTIAVERCARRK